MLINMTNENASVLIRPPCCAHFFDSVNSYIESEIPHYYDHMAHYTSTPEVKYSWGLSDTQDLPVQVKIWHVIYMADVNR